MEAQFNEPEYDENIKRLQKMSKAIYVFKNAEVFDLKKQGEPERLKDNIKEEVQEQRALPPETA